MQNLLEMLLGQQMQSVSPDATQYEMNLPLIEEEVEYDIPETAHSFIDNEISMSEMKPQVEGTGLGLLELAGKMVAPSSVTTLPNMIKQLQSTMKRMGNLKISSRQKLIDTANKRNYDAMSAEEVKKALDANKAAMKMAVDREELMTETQTLLDFLLNYQKRGF